MVAQTMVRQLISVVNTSIWSVRCRTLTFQTLNRIRGLNVPVQTLRKGIKRQEVLFVLRQATHRFWIALSVLGGSRRPIGSTPPAWWVAPRCQRVRLGPRHARVWGWRRAHCVVYAPGIADAEWPKTVPRPPPASRHDHQ